MLTQLLLPIALIIMLLLKYITLNVTKGSFTALIKGWMKKTLVEPRTFCLRLRLNEGQYLAWGVDPRQVGEVRVHRHTHHLTVDVVELIGLVAEWDDLCWTHKGAAIPQTEREIKATVSEASEHWRDEHKAQWRGETSPAHQQRLTQPIFKSQEGKAIMLLNQSFTCVRNTYKSSG